MKIYLNLLPQEKKNEIKRNRFFARILREEILFLLPLIVFIFFLLNIYYVLNYQYESLTAAAMAGKSQDKYQELNKYEDKFKEINGSVDLISKLQSNHLKWFGIMGELSVMTPDGIYLSELSTKNYQIFLLGKARSRDDLLNFKGKLESSSCFQNINVPLSNLVVKEDVDFQMDLMVNKDCLKK